MQTISVTHVDVATVDAARDAAVAAISDQIACPVVLSWHDRKTDAFAPSIPGGDPHERWRDYGTSMGGTHEVEVAERFDFIIGDADGFTEPKPKLRNMTDEHGNTYLCVEASCRKSSRRSLDEAYPAGGGIGGG